MGKTLLPRSGAACGAVFAIALFVANGDGSAAFNTGRAVAGLLALALAIPFIGYLCSLLSRAESPQGWLAGTALVAGTTGVALKMISGVPELVLHRTHTPPGTPLRAALTAIGDGTTLISLYPLAVFAAAASIVALRTRVLPRWLAIGAAITAIALATNAGFLTTTFVPALLVLALWMFLTSVWLTRSASRPGTDKQVATQNRNALSATRS